MNRTASRRTVAALGIGLAVALAGTQISVAQPGPRPLPANPQAQDRAPDRQDQQYDRPGDRQYRGQYDTRAGRGDREDRLERRLAFLHTQLRITPAQEPGWVAFTNVLRDEDRGRARDRDSANRDQYRRDDRGRADENRRGVSVVERLEERQRMLADRSADLDRVVRALRPLYASFSEDQRRTADRLMFTPGGDRGGRDFQGRDGGGPGFDRDRGQDSRAYSNYRR